MMCRLGYEKIFTKRCNCIRDKKNFEDKTIAKKEEQDGHDVFSCTPLLKAMKKL
jgi:hypothetical protein